MIRVHDLVKTYDDFRAVDNISFAVEPGEIFAFLGPNGAGKTTTIKMMCGLLFPTAGTIRIAGFDLERQGQEARQQISFVPDTPTIAESGVQGYEITAWNALFAPAGTPPEIVDLLNKKINEALAPAEVREGFLKVGNEPVGGEPEKLSELIRIETAKWAKVVKATGMKVD